MTRLDYKNVPAQLLDGAAESLAYGNTKYGEGKKRGKSSANDRYNSLVGHLQAWSNGAVADPESGLCHLKHAAMQLAFLMEASAEVEEEAKCVRPLASENACELLHEDDIIEEGDFYNSEGRRIHARLLVGYKSRQTPYHWWRPRGGKR